MPRTLLVVDDNPAVRDSLKFLLMRRGYEVLVAADGYEALRVVAENTVEGAMVDVNMPGMNGIDLCRELHRHAAAVGRPILVWMMTGARSPDLAKLSQEAGALDLLGKPFDLPSLFRRLEAELNRLGGDPASGNVSR